MPSYILIADDYEDNRELLQLILEMEGYATRAARDGRECVAIAQSDPPALALIDLSMPKLDGWHALRMIRENKLTKGVPCIALTAYAAESDRRRVLAAGFDAYISKPFNSKELLETISRLLSAPV